MTTLGIVGGGQLGRMLALAAQRLGFRVIVLDPTPESPAGQVANKQLVGSFKDPAAIRRLAEEADVITFEIESADADTLLALQKEGREIHPSPQTLLIIKDKFGQKEYLRKAGIPVADAMEVNGEEDIARVREEYGLPFLLKARRDAYDGRGNALIESVEDVEPALRKLGDRDLYAERFVPFVKELAVVAARDVKGEVRVYPVVETVHRNNICHQVIAPAPIPESTEQEARQLAARTMEALGGVGVCGIEMFLTEDGSILVNEVAPRVHNSGHHTIEACATSQFEQHVRAVTGMPLGDTALTTPAAVMINILGERSGPAALTGQEAFDGRSDAFLHVYGKFETRPERKMGHITVLADTVEEALEKALDARKRISI